MTRKDFILISSAIRAAVDTIKAEEMGSRSNASPALIRQQQAQYAEQHRGVRRAAAQLAAKIKLDQGDRFDATRFLSDCGFGGQS